jgi:hypothetical protein
MTTITGNALEWYAWEARASAISLEIKLRPSGMRSANLKRAWPGICAALGQPPTLKMTVKNLTKVYELAKARAAEVKTTIKPGEVTP